jgi:hypothetical protein
MHATVVLDELRVQCVVERRARVSGHGIAPFLDSGGFSQQWARSGIKVQISLWQCRHASNTALKGTARDSNVCC